MIINDNKDNNDKYTDLGLEMNECPYIFKIA
jgi:hypothetical protein